MFKMNKKIKGSKNLNVPNKRAQSQVYLNYAEHEEHLHKENVPNLRFPEFSGEWESNELHKVASLSKGIGISKDQLSDLGHPCILYGELYTKYKSEIIREVYSKTQLDVANLVKSHTNDVIIPCSGEAAIEIATARCVLIPDVLLGGDLNIIRLNGRHDGGFFAYQLNGKRKVDIAKVAQGVSVVHLYGEHLKKVKVAYPSLEEQQKISSFLALLDERIATQIKIIEKLESLIRGLYERLFNIDGAAYIQLGNVAKIQKGQQINGEKLSEIGSYYVMNGGVVPSGYLEDFNTPANTISISEGGNSCGYVQYNGVPFWSGGHCYTLIEPINSFNYKYLFHYLKFKEQSIMALRIGSGLPNIQKKDLERFPILNVSKEEQDKMACIFDDILDRIICERQIALKYEEQKKYLLSNLFI